MAKINKLERDLLVVTKEAAMLQEKLQVAESQVKICDLIFEYLIYLFFYLF